MRQTRPQILKTCNKHEEPAEDVDNNSIQLKKLEEKEKEVEKEGPKQKQVKESDHEPEGD